jgi:ribonuclease Y
VDSDRVTDEISHQIAQQVAKTIETSLQYPGQIKVTVIREKRAEAYAR